METGVDQMGMIVYYLVGSGKAAPRNIVVNFYWESKNSG
jgi:hypothetical protein